MENSSVDSTRVALGSQDLLEILTEDPETRAIIFVEGPGGGGKTYFIRNSILRKFRGSTELNARLVSRSRVGTEQYSLEAAAISSFLCDSQALGDSILYLNQQNTHVVVTDRNFWSQQVYGRLRLRKANSPDDWPELTLHESCELIQDQAVMLDSLRVDLQNRLGPFKPSSKKLYIHTIFYIPRLSVILERRELAKKQRQFDAILELEAYLRLTQSLGLRRFMTARYSTTFTPASFRLRKGHGLLAHDYDFSFSFIDDRTEQYWSLIPEESHEIPR